MRPYWFIGISFLVMAMTGCTAKPSGRVAIIDVEDVVTHWPAMQERSDQIVAQRQALEQTSNLLASSDKTNAELRLQDQAARLQLEIAARIRKVAVQVAAERGLELVVTRDLVAYGGRDISADIIARLTSAKVVKARPSQPAVTPQDSAALSL